MYEYHVTRVYRDNIDGARHSTIHAESPAKAIVSFWKLDLGDMPDMHMILEQMEGYLEEDIQTTGEGLWWIYIGDCCITVRDTGFLRVKPNGL